MQTTEQQMRAEIKDSGFSLSEEELAFATALAQNANYSLRSILTMVDAVRSGVSHAEFCGVTPALLERIEQYGTARYRAKQYDEAFTFFYGANCAGELMGKSRPTALRGMAACNHCQSFLLDAIDQYQAALRLDPSDLTSRVSLASCLCLVGLREQGLVVAHQAMASKRRDKDALVLVAQAQRLIQSKGGQPMLDGARRRSRSTQLQPQPATPSAAKLADTLLDASSR